jgi:TatD DNase family protein
LIKMPVTVIAAKPAEAEAQSNFRFIDIGVNLTDPVFRGVHHGRKKHDDDFDAMLQRSRAAGVKSMIITGGSLKESRQALKLAKEYGLYATIGCHPTRSTEFDKYNGGPEAYLQDLDKLIEANINGKGRVVAIGECGLDYDRTHFASQDVQQRHFRSQLYLAKKYHLPLFLHSRAAHADFVRILREEGFGEDGGRAQGAWGGVVHSFTGSVAEALECQEMGFHIRSA